MKLTVQLYTLRNELDKDLEGTLRSVKGFGLDYVELAGTYGRSAAEWKTLLDAIGLKVSGSHIGIGQLESEFDAVVADNQLLGNRYIILPWVGEDFYGAGWDAAAKRVEPIAAKLKAAGLNFCYHNHDFEFRGEGKPGLEVFYESSDPDLVKAQLDLAWVQIGGHDPADWVKRMGKRAPLVHLKDFDPDKTPRWVPGGQGKVNWDVVLVACEEAGVEFGGIELDESPGSALDAVEASVAYFRGKGLG